MRTMKRVRCRTGLALRVLALVGGGLLLGPEAASAQTCINDVWKAHGNNQNVTCTANDVTLSSATNIQIITGGTCDPVTGVCSCFATLPITFTADFRMDLTADTRYDVGFYIATDGDTSEDGALTGQCTATASLAGNTQQGTFINLDAAPDVCGDITGPLNTANNPLFVRATISTTCPATGNLQLPFATTWRQPGSNQVCSGTGNGTTTNDVFPGSPSKCNLGVLTLPITAVPTTIDVQKDSLTPSVPETGGSAVYRVVVTNTSAIDITLQTLTDNKYGNITSVHAAGGGFLAVTATGCATGGVILASGGTYTCQFTGTVPPGDFGGPDFTDTVTACADNVSNPTDVCDTDPASVPYADVSSPPTLTKTATPQCVIDVRYDVVVNNTNGLDTLTLNTLNDNVYNNITTTGHDNIQSTTCGVAAPTGAGALPFTIAAGGNYACNFVARINVCSTTVNDTVTGGTVDEDGVPFNPTDGAGVVVNVTTN